MLATKANVYFREPAGELKNRYVGEFWYKNGAEDMMCSVEMMDLFSIGVDAMRESVVQQINDKMCRTYPYPELLELKPLEPRASQHVDALAKTIVDAARDLTDPNAGMLLKKEEPRKDAAHQRDETWPQVVQRCIAQFKDTVTTLDVLFAFFEPVVRNFLERGYAQGFKEGLESGRTVFIRKLEFALQYVEDIEQFKLTTQENSIKLRELWEEIAQKKH